MKLKERLTENVELWHSDSGHLFLRTNFPVRPGSDVALLNWYELDSRLDPGIFEYMRNKARELPAEGEKGENQ